MTGLAHGAVAIGLSAIPEVGGALAFVRSLVCLPVSSS
jgi:hypothetical protein